MEGGPSLARKHQASVSTAQGPGDFWNQPWEEDSCRDHGPCRQRDPTCDEEASFFKQHASFCVSACELDPRGLC